MHAYTHTHRSRARSNEAATATLRDDVTVARLDVFPSSMNRPIMTRNAGGLAVDGCVYLGTYMTLDPYAVAWRPDARTRVTRPRARRTSHGTHADAIARGYLCVIAHENGRDARIVQGLGERHGEARERQRRGCGVVLRASARGDGVVRDGDTRKCSFVCLCARARACVRAFVCVLAWKGVLVAIGSVFKARVD